MKKNVAINMCILKYKFARVLVLSLCAVMCFTSTDASAKVLPHTMKSIPENGLNIDWPVLDDNRYFTYKGRNARQVTLRSIMAINRHIIIDLYDEDPQLALDDIEFLILVQFSLRGIDVQTMEPEARRSLALTEISKRLRQFGRIDETNALFQTPLIIPSASALCHILETLKEDILRQKYHDKYKWDLHKVEES